MSLIREREALRGEISAFCKKLVLSQRAVELCETEATPKQEEFLHRVLAEEMESRERSRRSRLMSRAGFPVYKTEYFGEIEPSFRSGVSQVSGGNEPPLR